jgi:hypothetical protein
MTPDIITNAIIAALSAGAVAGAKDTAKTAIVEAYQGLKTLIKTKLGHDSNADRAIHNLETEPSSAAWKEILTGELKKADSSSDPELVSATQALLELIRALPSREKHVQFAQGTGIAQADRGSTATVTMGAAPRKDD